MHHFKRKRANGAFEFFESMMHIMHFIMIILQREAWTDTCRPYLEEWRR